MTDRLPDLIPPATLLTPEEARHGVTAYCRALIDRIGMEVTAAREERQARLGPDTPLGRSDVAPLVRNLAGLADVLDYASRGLRDAAKAAREHVGDEVRETGGATVVVPDGMGKEVVAKVTAPRSRKVDTPALLDALAAVRRVEHTRAVAADPPTVSDGGSDSFDLDASDVAVAAHAAGYRLALDDVQSLGKVEPRVTSVDALARTLMAAGQDDLAGLVDRTLRWEAGDEKVTVTVEDPKSRRRA